MRKGYRLLIGFLIVLAMVLTGSSVAAALGTNAGATPDEEVEEHTVFRELSEIERQEMTDLRSVEDLEAETEIECRELWISSEAEDFVAEPVVVVPETTASPEVEFCETEAEVEVQVADEAMEVENVETEAVSDPGTWVCPLSQSELDLFAALVWSEAGDQPIPDGLCYVADVVLNRRDSPAWPNTIEGVIYQPGQFSVVSNGALNRAYGNVPQVCYDAIISQLQNRWRYDILYFSMGYNANGNLAFVHGTHYYST